MPFCRNGKPTMMVEAKKLGALTGLEEASDQGILYCAQDRNNYFSVTDGQRYGNYMSPAQTCSHCEKSIGFDLKGSSSAEVCLKALALWMPSVPRPVMLPPRKSRSLRHLKFLPCHCNRLSQTIRLFVLTMDTNGIY